MIAWIVITSIALGFIGGLYIGEFVTLRRYTKSYRALSAEVDKLTETLEKLQARQDEVLEAANRV
jgi:hypothetical protein